MTSTCLKSIKYESIKAIFTSIADAEKISRAEISEKTDLSLVTVGKIADALLDLDVICQVKEIRPHAGRRAGVLSVNENKFAMILDITSYPFRIAFLNLQLNLIEHTHYTYQENISFEENLNTFFYEAYALMQDKYSPDNCFGIGIALPGPYNSETDRVSTNRIPELRSISIGAFAKTVFPHTPILMDSHINAAARSNITHVEGYLHKSMLYWYIASDYVCGAHMAGGELILGKDNHACDFGRLVSKRGATLENLISQCADAATCAEALSGSIYNVIKVINPHTLIMEFDLPFACDNIFSYIKALLKSRYGLEESEIPEFKKACCRFRNSHRGLTMGLRELWLDRIVFGNPQD